jgi:hypothetical protein
LSTEPTVSPPPTASVAERCKACGAPLAADQRYCLECGEPRAPMSSVLLGGSPYRAGSQSETGQPAKPPGAATGAPAGGERGRPNNALTVIAGVGVLLLAMGVGVLIGRSGAASKSSTPPPQVISVPAQSSSGASSEAASAAFTSDWPSGTSGYTVQLQTLGVSGTQVSAVEAAKLAASAKGAKNVGALKSEEFSSLASGNYVIYSGVYHKKTEAEKALPTLKRLFPGAKVVSVSNGSSGSSESSGASETSSNSSKSTGAGGLGSGAKHGTGFEESKPAPPKVVEKLQHSRGKNYEQESKNLPDVLSTG